MSGTPDYAAKSREILALVRMATHDQAVKIIELELGCAFDRGAIKALQSARDSLPSPVALLVVAVLLGGISVSVTTMWSYL